MAARVYSLLCLQFLPKQNRHQLIAFFNFWFIHILCMVVFNTSMDQAISFAVAIMCSTLWFTKALSAEMTSLLGILALSVPGTLTISDALSGASSNAVWLVWAGSTVGRAFMKCGVNARIVSLTVGFTNRFDVLLMRVLVLCFVTCALVPSSVSRELLLTPLAPMIRDACRHAPIGELSELQLEAVALILITGASKP